MTPPDTPPTTPTTASEAVPLAIWPCGQTTAKTQRAGRYLPAASVHPAKMLPELARRIITTYSKPGELVCDPMCGIGTTLVEAALLDRRAVGVELEPRWATLARRNLIYALDPQHADGVQLLEGDARALTALLGERAGTVDLVATSPPYGCDISTLDMGAYRQGGSSRVAGTRYYSTDPANLGHARGQRYLEAMAAVYAACATVLRPGGLLVTVTRNPRPQGRLFDLTAATVQLAQQAGLVYLQHVIALRAGIRDGRLVPPPSLRQRINTRNARARGVPVHLPVHEDVLVFCRLAPNDPGTAAGVVSRG
jgi:modification methylase